MGWAPSINAEHLILVVAPSVKTWLTVELPI